MAGSAFDKQTSVGPQLGHILLVAFQYLYSVRNGRKNGAIPDFGHNDLTLEQKVQHYSAAACGVAPYPTWAPKNGWAPPTRNCPRDYGERIALVGIQPFTDPNRVYEARAIQTMGEVALTESLAFYAKQLQLKLRILTLHCGHEYKLFTTLLLNDSGSRTPDYEGLLHQWRSHVDGSKVFPKEVCHLRWMYQRWESIVDTKKLRERVDLAAIQSFIKRCNETFDQAYCDYITDMTATADHADVRRLARLVDQSFASIIAREESGDQQQPQQQQQPLHQQFAANRRYFHCSASDFYIPSLVVQKTPKTCGCSECPGRQRRTGAGGICNATAEDRSKFVSEAGGCVPTRMYRLKTGNCVRYNNACWYSPPRKRARRGHED